jgi:hypothetical protein
MPMMFPRNSLAELPLPLRPVLQLTESLLHYGCLWHAQGWEWWLEIGISEHLQGVDPELHRAVRQRLLMPRGRFRLNSLKTRSCHGRSGLWSLGMMAFTCGDLANQNHMCTKPGICR